MIRWASRSGHTYSQIVVARQILTLIESHVYMFVNVSVCLSVCLCLSVSVLFYLFPCSQISTRTLQDVLDELTTDEKLKAVLAYSYGDYGMLGTVIACHWILL